MNKPFVSFDSALDQHLKNGASGTTFYNPVMHYDLETMGKHFTAVDESAGIYVRDGVFYASVDLAGKKSLQPVGISNGTAEGLSESLSDEQKELFGKLMDTMKKMKEDGKLSDEDAQKKLMDLVKNPEEVEKLKDESSKGDSNPPAPGAERHGE
jgi:hypothetical protein